MKNDKRETYTLAQLDKLLDQDPGYRAVKKEVDEKIAVIEKALDLMKRKGMTHLELAKKSGIPRASVSRFLCGGIDNFSYDWICKLFAPLGYLPKISFVPIKPSRREKRAKTSTQGK